MTANFGSTSSLTPLSSGYIAGASPSITGGSSFNPMAGLGMSSLGAGFDVYQGLAASQQYGLGGSFLKQNANIALQQASLDAQAKAMEVQQYAGNQAEEYNSSGITGAGTPAQVLAMTRSLGQREVNAIAQRGAFQAQLYRTQANQAKSAGRSAMVGGIANAAMKIAPFFI